MLHNRCDDSKYFHSIDSILDRDKSDDIIMSNFLWFDQEICGSTTKSFLFIYFLVLKHICTLVISPYYIVMELTTAAAFKELAIVPPVIVSSNGSSYLTGRCRELES